MQGRGAGERGNVVMTDYLAAELARIGVAPAGENGTYFQTIPMVRRRPDPTSSLAVDNALLAVNTDFVPVRPTSSLRSGIRIAVERAGTVYGGRAGDTTVSLRPDQVAGKVVVLAAPLGRDGKPTATYATPTGLAVAQFASAAAIAVSALDLLTPTAKASVTGRGNGLGATAENPPLALLVSRRAAERLMGAPLASLRPGAAGRPVSARIGFVDTAVSAPARNVVGMIRGSDPRLMGQFVAIGAHSDHIGTRGPSRRSRFASRIQQGHAAGGTADDSRAPVAAEWARIHVILDSLRRLGPPRRDSINNGADDDGSGSVAALEIAESIAPARRPRRSDPVRLAHR